MKSYRVLKPFTDGNSWHADGVILALSDKQATFLLAAGNITLHTVADPVATVEPEASEPAKKAAK